MPTLAYSVNAAKAELAQSAFPKGFSTELLIQSGDQAWSEAAQIIQQYLKAINIDVSITALDNAAYTAAFYAYNYQMMINGATNDISDPDEMASFEVDVKSGGSHSFSTPLQTTRPQSPWSTRLKPSSTAPSGRRCTSRSRRSWRRTPLYTARLHPQHLRLVT